MSTAKAMEVEDSNVEEISLKNTQPEEKNQHNLKIKKATIKKVRDPA